MTHKRKIEAEYNNWVSQMLEAQTNYTTHLLPPEPPRPNNHSFNKKDLTQETKVE